MFYKILVKIIRVFDFIFYGFRKPDNSIIPKDEGIIVCSNHPGLRDPLFIAESIDRPLTFMSKKELFKFKPFGALIKSLGAFPVDRGNNDIAAVKTAIRLLKGNKALLMFPQGTRSKKEDNRPGKQGAVRLAILTGAKILPVGLSDNNHMFKKVHINIGEPIDYSSYKRQDLESEDYDRMTKELMDTIYSLAEDDKK